ncbi:MAG: lysophospholipid acyltransferase family protein [Candidatus Omnitrophota bacterium]|jgi:1-acyl-sn-glycerol-3-phosphate acyltransferase
MLYWFLRFLSFLILKIFFRLEVKGRENLPKKGGFILAGNHISYLDPVVIGVAVPRKLNYLAKRELFRNRASSWFFSKLHIFPIKRDSADISALKEALRRVRNDEGLVLFPEGSRRLDSSSAEAEPGVGFLAAKLDVPVIPAFVRGTERALPRGAKFLKPARISVCFGKQIPIERRLPYQDIAQQIMANIRRIAC